MARQVFKGKEKSSKLTADGAYRIVVPVHPVDRLGYSAQVGGSWFDHDVNDFLKNSSNASDMNVNGSVTPVEFYIAPPANESWQIVSILFTANATSGITTTNFFGAAALTNGCLWKVTRGATEIYDFFDGSTAMTTRSFMRRFYFGPAPAFPGQLLFMQSQIYTNELYGKYLELDGKQSDRMVFTVRDNLTSLAALCIHVHGWKEPSL